MPRIGPYTLHAIETGRFGLDGGAMFGIVPKPLWERRIAPDDRNRIPLHMRCLLLKGADRCILIDTGLGEKHDAKFADLYAVDHESADLLGSLASVGVRPADVTDVVLTHLHFDHAGGSTRHDGDRLVPTFPEARYHIQRSHWDWASAPNGKEKNSFRPIDFDPLMAAGQVRLVDGEVELCPGVEVLTVHGHTHAQQIVKISGPEGTLVYVADLLPTSAHLRPPWIMAYDVRPLVTLDEKERFLRAAHAEGWHLFFEHDPEVEVASLQKTERGFRLTKPRSLDELF